jgi:hypothetical protein
MCATLLTGSPVRWIVGTEGFVVHTLVFRFLLLGLSVAVGIPGLAPDAPVPIQP